MCPRRATRLTALWVMSALIAASCGGSGDGIQGDVATAVPPSAETTTDATAPSPTTEPGMVNDLFEVLEVAGPVAEQASDDLTVALEGLRASCDGGTVTVADLEGVIEPLDRFGAAIEDLKAEISPTLRALLYQEFEATALLLNDCAPIADADATAAMLATTGRVTAALDRYFGRIQANRNSAASSIWGSRDRLAAALWVRDLMATDTELDVLVVGSSVSKRAYDPVQMSAGLDAAVGNAGGAGSSPELMAPWLREIRHEVRPETIIWGVSSTDLYTWCQVEGRVEGYHKSADKRPAAFAAVTGGPQPGWAHLLGPIGAATYTDTLLLDAVTEDYEPGTRGRSINGTGPNRDVIDRLVDEHVDEFIAGEVCAARFAVLDAALTELVDDGIEVIVVALPMLDELAELHPDGVQGPQDALAEVGRGLPAGVRFIDHSASIDSQLFADTFHVTEEGRDQLTDRLLAELGP